METGIGKPDWLRIKLVNRPEIAEMRALLREHSLRTVCDSAHCPNLCECWSNRSATFLIMGGRCTRHCAFCAVPSGAAGDRLDPEEPAHLAEMVDRTNLDHTVITSVTRDDLPDHGAGHYVEVLRAVRSRSKSRVELLVPDLGGDERRIRSIVEERPDVFAHNVETVRRLQPQVRDARASYDISLQVLRKAKELDGTMLTKSSLMLGLGETMPEVLETMRDLRRAGVTILTIGQYLRPNDTCVPVARYIGPEVFQRLKEEGTAMGFRYVASGPFVRSSYQASKAYEFAIGGK